MVRCNDERLRVVGYKDLGHYEMPSGLAEAFATLELRQDIKTTKSHGILWVKLIYVKGFKD